MPPKRPKGPDRGLIMIAHDNNNNNNEDAIEMLDGPLAKTMEVRGDFLPGTVADRGSLEMNDPGQRFHVFTFPVSLNEVRRAVGDYSLGGVYIKAIATGRIVEQFSFANDLETYTSYIGEHRAPPHELPANLQSKRSLVAWRWADIAPLQKPFYIEKRGRQNWVYFDLRADVVGPLAGATMQNAPATAAPRAKSEPSETRQTVLAPLRDGKKKCSRPSARNRRPRLGRAAARSAEPPSAGLATVPGQPRRPRVPWSSRCFRFATTTSRGG